MTIGTIVLEREPLAFESLTPTTSTGITAAILRPSATQMEAQWAFITVETNQVRFRIDGTDPTASAGHVIAAGSSILLRGANTLRNLRFIDTAAGASTVRVTTFA